MHIAHALTTSRIGGFSLAHETRKVNFLKQAPVFLRDLIGEFGIHIDLRDVVVNPIPIRQSGTVSYESEGIRFELSEDPNESDGVKLKYKINRSGTSMVGTIPIMAMMKAENFDRLMQPIKMALQNNVTA